eukprot:gene5693-6882_t
MAATWPGTRAPCPRQQVGESEDYLVPETLRDKLSSDARLEAIYQEQLKEVEQLNLEEKLAKAWKPPEVIEKVKKKESRLLQSRVDRRSELQCIETTRRMVALLVGLLVAILAVVAQFECTPTTDDDWYKECGYVELCSQRRNEEPYNCRWVKDPLHHPEDGLTLDAQYENLIQSEILANLICDLAARGVPPGDVAARGVPPGDLAVRGVPP